ncbi:MAG: translocation/assembly module TamB, partial [Chlamydiales bacterium]|nr:translocation/assembly module TamB [Chlamydiales bacterium]
IQGSIESATARGEIHVIQSDLVIPETFSKAPPKLHVVYLNAQKPLASNFRSPKKAYPLYLDISIDTPNSVEISGRGLQSQWQGNFALKGNSSVPELIGQLTLINGEFSFSGRVFKLTQGAVSFSEKTLVPHIDLSGNVHQQGMIITAHLQGPLNKPQLTFQSAPPLPLSSIIAYLLFGQEISEINGLQALQLATAVANIAGQSADVLESTRRSLGIDRLRIISEPGSEGNETLSIQVGKYVAPGVIVFITQSTDETAPNISIEADIGAGFFFHAETDQVHEQGKFGIKWNRNY